MKARKETPTPIKNDLYGSQELKRARKLKPVKKEKNQKQSLFQEIDELEDIELVYKNDLMDEDYFDDEAEDDDY
jgi:hypothetical protein